MADKEVKVRITTDASGSVTGFKMLRDEMDKTEKQSSSLVSKIKTHWLGLSAAVAGASALIYEAWNLAEGGANYIEQMQNLDALALKYGSSSTEITSRIRSIGDGMITMATTAEVAYGGLAKKLDPEKLYGLADAATVLNDSMNMTADEAFKTMASALELNKEKSLKLAIGTIDLKERYGDLADKMTEAQKQTAFYNLIMEKTEEIKTRLGNSTKSLADEMETFKVTVADLKTELGIGLVRAGAGVIGMFQWLAAGVLTATSAFPRLMEYVSLASAKIYEWTGQTDRMNQARSESSIFGKAADDMLGAAGELTGKAANNFSLLTSSTEDLVKAQGKAVASSGNLHGAIKSLDKDVEKSWKEMAMTLTEKIQSAGLDDIDRQLLQVDFNAKKLISRVEEMQKKGLSKTTGNYLLELIGLGKESEINDAIMKLEKQGAKSYEDLVKDIVAADEKMASDRIAAQRDMYSDLRGYEDSFYAANIALIEKQIERYRELQIDEIAITAWAEEEKRKAKLKYDRETGTQDMGFYQGLSDWRKSLQTDFEFGEDMAKTTATSMQSTFSNVFFDAFKGDLKDFKTYWDSFCDAILRKFTDRVADMVTNWVMGLTEMKSAEASSGLSGLIGGAGSLLSSLFGGSSGAGLGVAGGTAADAIAAGAIVLHGGGVVGIDSAPMRYVPASAFSGAPRYHKGFMPGEVPAILQRGESVLTPAQMQALGKSENAGTINVTYNVQCLDPKTLADVVSRNASIFQNVTLKGLRDNKTRTEMKGLLK